MGALATSTLAYGSLVPVDSAPIIYVLLVELSSDIAEAAARIRAKFRLNLADAVQAASALAINAAALVTHDRDFARLRGVRVLF